MEVKGTDYSFATKTGSPTSPYGEIHDCNGEDFRSPCPYFSSAIINTRETGLVVSPSVTWGKVSGWATAIRNFKISSDGTEITFGCLGWCGICGPSTGSITFQVSNEFVSAAAATAVICQT
ncbi:A disintegrin and metalloproteinase with thrombospondin motifs 9-like [Saccostrea cucullata]|uniref:A disintegrin and metalloproteinase with thrombospondin motifs 9-like n=1 Tax=Saccostrea cuccullata TaxID=36930 RepID=UPI002ED4BBA4